MNLQFFHQRLTERRSYDYNAWYIEFIQRELDRMVSTYPGSSFPTISDGPLGNWGCPSTTVSHVVSPPVSGILALEEQFKIKLPADFGEFYKLHNEAFILGRNPVLIMNPQQIIAVSEELRDAHEIPEDLPRHIIRFGWLGNDSYFLLRYNRDVNEWEVMLSSYSHATDVELQSGSAWGTPCDRTFTNWLSRMIETDGAPLHPQHLENEDDFWVKRIA